MKKKPFFAILMGGLLLGLLFSVSMASSSFSGFTNVPITTGSLGVTLSQSQLDFHSESGTLMPGDTIPQEIYATTSGNYDSYLRIRCLPSLEASPTNAANEALPFQLLIAAPSDWILIFDSAESSDIYLYYRHPLKPDSKIPVLNGIQFGETLEELDNQWTDCKISCPLTAETVQCLKGQPDINRAALEDCWNISVTFDKEDSITYLKAKNIEQKNQEQKEGGVWND